MAFLKLDQLPDFSWKYAKNRWADFVELICIDNIDKEVSLNDIMNIYVNENFFSTADDESPSEKDNKYFLLFSETFLLIKSRSQLLKKYYPFEFVNKSTIKMSLLTNDNLLYIYLLLSSNTSCLEGSLASKFTNSFEGFSQRIMGYLYPTFQSYLFGTSRTRGDLFYGGTLRDRLDRLSKCLNTNLRKNETINRHNDEFSGDRKIDVVAFYQIDCESYNAPFIPVSIGQCSCSYEEWEDKQSSVFNRRFKNMFEEVATCHEYMFIPFSLRGINGKWASDDISSIQTIVIDRFRFFSILDLSKISADVIITDEIKDCLKNALEQLYAAFQ